MSDIQLSAELFQGIENAVSAAHPGADQGLVMQYLAAVMGYMAASQQQMSDAQAKEFVDQLCGFAQHVFADVRGQAQRQQQASAEAFGVWEPGQD